MGVGAVAGDPGDGLRPRRSAVEARIITSAAAPSEIDEALAAVIAPSLAKAGFSVGILAGIGLQRLLVVAHRLDALAAGDLDRDDLAVEGAALDRRLGAGEALDRVGVHVGAGELIGGGGLLGESAHQLAGVVGVLQAVEVHGVHHPVVADARAAAVLGQQIGRVGHALHAAGDDDLGRARGQRVVGHDRRLHARAAHLVDRGRLDALRQARAERRLARRGLAEARGQHAAHEDLVDRLRPRRRPAPPPPRTAAAPELRGGRSGEAPWKPPIGVRA